MEWGSIYPPKDEPILDPLASLLSREIMSHPKPKGFKCLKLISYDRVEDQKNYVYTKLSDTRGPPHKRRQHPLLNLP